MEINPAEYLECQEAWEYRLGWEYRQQPWAPWPWQEEPPQLREVRQQR